jgi:hypothetical protein
MDKDLVMSFTNDQLWYYFYFQNENRSNVISNGSLEFARHINAPMNKGTRKAEMSTSEDLNEIKVLRNNSSENAQVKVRSFCEMRLRMHLLQWIVVSIKLYFG